MTRKARVTKEARKALNAGTVLTPYQRKMLKTIAAVLDMFGGQIVKVTQ
jgi:hypothetical protein